MIKILIIEDDLKVRKGLKLVLEMNDYKVFLAENGTEGVKLANEILPDLILCDIMMPVMDGYQVINELAKRDETAVIPFLYLTARVDVLDIRKGLKLGADDYLLKPIKENELLTSVRGRLAKFKRIKSTITENDKKNENTPLSQKSTIMVNVKNNPKLISVKEIIFIEADNQYSKVCFKIDGIVLVKKSLSKWEKFLPEDLFIRIHRSVIVNIKQISKLIKWSSNTMKVYIKDSDQTFIISQRYLKKVKSKLHSV